MPAQLDRNYLKMRPGKVWARLLAYALFEGRPLTTRGRWFNPVVFGVLGAANRLPQAKRVRAPIFIIGTGRSGSTILGTVLSTHRDVGFLNEPKAIWYTVSRCDDLVGSYTDEPARYRLDAADATPSMRTEVQRIYGLFLRAAFADRILDKYPEMVFRTSFIKQMFPDAKFLFLSRNGEDACASIERWSQRLGQELPEGTVDWWGRDRRKWNLLVDQIVSEHDDLKAHGQALRAEQRHSVMAAVEWIVSMREGLSLLQSDPEHVLHVPYERLCRDPESMLGEIFDFAELRDDSKCRAYASHVLAIRDSNPELVLPRSLEPAFESVQARLGHVSRGVNYD